MTYVGDPLKGFGDYQRNEYKSPNRSRLGQINGQLGGYEKVPANYGLSGYQDGYGEEVEVQDLTDSDNPFEGSDAFAGYLSAAADEDTIEEVVEDVLEDEASGGLGSYGESAAGALQSWHSHFHKASLERTENGIIKALAQAVSSVPNDTPDDTRRQYYNLALQMLHRRKKTDIRHLDIDRVELQSNIGWLINPNVPKKGGFNALVAQSVGRLGPALGKDTAEQQKLRGLETMGRKLKSNLRKTGQLAGLGLGFGDNKTMMYLGIGVAAVAAYYYLNKKPAAPLRKRRRRKKK